jgi:hypothetical protein
MVSDTMFRNHALTPVFIGICNADHHGPEFLEMAGITFSAGAGANDQDGKSLTHKQNSMKSKGMNKHSVAHGYAMVAEWLI